MLVVLTGGFSSEAGVAYRNARLIYRFLKASGYRVRVDTLEPSGWKRDIPDSLLDPWCSGPSPTYACDPLRVIEGYCAGARSGEVVLPVIHGPFVESGELSRCLEGARVSFIGSSCGAAQQLYNKVALRSFLSALGLPQPPHIAVSSSAHKDTPRAVQCQISRNFGSTEVIIKPAGGGSSHGISVVPSKNMEDVNLALEKALRHFDVAIVEQFIWKRQELCVTLVFGKDGADAALAEIEYSSDFLDRRAKFTGQYTLQPFRDISARKVIIEALHLICNAVQPNGFIRFDVLIDFNDVAYVIECDVVPSIGPDSVCFRSFAFDGMSYASFMAMILGGYRLQ